MASASDTKQKQTSRARVLDQLRERLDAAGELARLVRESLTRGDADSIRKATARLETLVLEYRVLAREYQALPDPDEPLDPVLLDALDALEASATRVARSSAVTGGVLERLVAVSRGIVSALGGGQGGGAYLPSGRTSEITPRGVQLRERA